MILVQYSPEELLAMREIFVERRKKASRVYHTVKVEGSHDKPNISKRVRIGRVLQHCDRRTNEIDMRLKFEYPSKVDVRKRKLRGKHTERLADILAQFPKRDPNLPEFLIGNVVLEELPFNKLYEELYDHHRLTVFVNKGLKCVHPECNRVASRLIKTVGGGGDVHIDVFTHDFKHMNVDHIHPVSKGGSDELWNKQPMCAHHNSRKSNHLSPY